MLPLLLAKASPGHWIGLVLALLPIAYLAYYGIQSLSQASLLRRAVPLGALDLHVGQKVSVHGHARRVDDGSDRLGGELWVRTRTQRWHSGWGGGRRGWRTVQTEEQGWDFVLSDQGGEVLVRTDATEVHGAEQEGQSLLGSFFDFGPGWSGSEYRTLRTTLRDRRPLTVCGRVARAPGGGYVIVKDDEVGQLLSTRAPSTQALEETLKGVVSVVVLPLAWFAGLGWLMFVMR
ncbi:MAG: GIDE domain-containing protein [Planctomycetota bacterium]